MQNLWALVYSFAYVFLVILMAEIMSRFIKSKQVTRKIIHILCGNWIFIAFLGFNSGAWAIIPPMVFMVLNYISFKKDLIASMEGKKSMGTVYYALSLLVLTGLGWVLQSPAMAYIGILSMAYGDGFAAVLGEKFGVQKWQNSDKTYMGSMAVFSFTVLITLLVGIYFGDGQILAQYGAGYLWPIALLCGGFATYIELYGKHGLDNISLPIGVALVYYYYIFAYRHGQVLGFWIIAGLSLVVLGGAIYTQAITPNGAGFAYLIALIFFGHGGYLLYGGLILFFVLGSLTSKYKKDQKQAGESLHERQGARSWVQVLANSFSILLLLWLGEAMGQQEVSFLAAFAVLAAAAADTVSSDLGMLTKGKTFSILSGKPVTKGLSGGVSWLGFLSGFLASLCLAMPLVPLGRWKEVVVLVVLGFLGTIVDSILGDLFQVKYLSPEGHLTERQGQETRFKLKSVRGLQAINNDWVNFISLTIIAIVSFIVFLNI